MSQNKINEKYFSYCRQDLVDLVPVEAKTILEIGCGVGNTGRVLKSIQGREVVGVDIVPEVKEKADKVYDLFVLGNIENMELKYPDGFFDCIIYGDVLEHLIDPWMLLKKHHKLLKPGGCVIASIPNIRYYRVMKDLLFNGRFDYKESGIMDKTHLRFFTLNGIMTLFQNADFELVNINRKIRGSKAMKFFNFIFLGRIKEFLSFQYIIKATK